MIDLFRNCHLSQHLTKTFIRIHKPNQNWQQIYAIKSADKKRLKPKKRFQRNKLSKLTMINTQETISIRLMSIKIFDDCFYNIDFITSSKLQILCLYIEIKSDLLK